MTRKRITLYIDFKSPYSYLALEPARQLERDFPVTIEWRPYMFDIAISFGDPEARAPLEWRKIRYTYMDIRRWANQRGMIIYGPRKAFDSSLANIAMLHAQDRGVFPAYANMTYERFFKRALDIEDRDAIRAVLNEAGADTAGFFDFAAGAGRERLARIAAEANEQGVFGVPTFILDGELFWGHDRVALLRERLAGG
jgi:2-hydroxychromene-2-carboxylate isomerase